jgi:hypothetical protein
VVVEEEGAVSGTKDDYEAPTWKREMFWGTTSSYLSPTKKDRLSNPVINVALRACSQLLCCAKEGFNTFLQYHVLFAAFVEGKYVCMPKVLFWWVVLLRATLERTSTCHRDGQLGFAPRLCISCLLLDCDLCTIED